jgi:hypothetical protein
MSDVALRNAERQRDEMASRINAAQSQIDEWRREIGRIDQFISDWHRFAGADEAKAESAAALATVRKTTGNSDKEEVARVARELIRKEGKPIQRSELLKRLREHGLIIEGANPETVLSTMLWRMKDEARIVHIRQFGYWLKEEDYRPAGYSEKFEELIEDTDDGQADTGDE